MVTISPTWNYLEYLFKMFRQVDPDAFAHVNKRACVYCGVAFKIGHPKDRVTKEHILPARDGGILVVPACHHCNQMRGRAPIRTFLASKQLRQRREAVIAASCKSKPPVPDEMLLRIHEAAKLRGKIFDTDRARACQNPHRGRELPQRNEGGI